MRRFSLFFALLFFVPAASAWAQVDATARTDLEGAFTYLLNGKYLEAEAGFLRVASEAPEGSRERWIGKEMAEITRQLDEKKARRVSPDKAAFSAAFSLWLEGRALDAQSAFLTAAASAPEGTQPREMGKLLSETTRRYEGFYQPAPANTPPANTPPANPTPINPGVPSSPPDTSGYVPGYTPGYVPPQPPPPFQPEDPSGYSSGRAEILVNGASFGIYSAITGAVLLNLGDQQEDGPLLTLMTIGGAAAGGLLGYGYIQANGGDISAAKAGPISIGGLLGAGQGAFSLVLLNVVDGEVTDGKEAVTTIWLHTAAGYLGGAVISALTEPSRGDSYLVGSSALWGTTLSLGILGIVQPTDGKAAAATLNSGYAAGIVSGMLFATQVDLSPRRLWVINRAGGLGLLAGASAGGLVAASLADGGDNAAALSFFSTLTIAGGLSGLILGFYTSQDLGNGGAYADLSKNAKPRLKFDGVAPGFAQGKTATDRPFTLNAAFTF